MDTAPDAVPAVPSSQSAAPLDAAYCGPEPDFTEIAALYADIGIPR
ncbi:MAG TPA: hypothetical protein VN915_14515 [Elusimicrobiota bacterium]|nr:hypothetical protein [Elusimicrobiota bacterium]